MLWPSEVLPTPGGPTKHRIGLLPCGIELAHREVLEDPALDLVEAVVVLVEDAPRLRDVDRVVAQLRPGQLDQPVEIGAHHRVLGRGLGHALQALQLLPRLLLGLLGHAGLGDRLLQLLDLGGGALGLAELLLDRLQLLAQDVLALAALDRVLGLLADVARDLEHLDPVAEQLQDPVQPAPQVDGLEDLLLLLDPQIHEARDQVGGERGRARRLHGVDQLGRHLRQQLQGLQRPLLQAYRRASISGVALSGSSIRSMRAARNGWPGTNSRTRKRCWPWQTMWWLPSGAVT